MAVLDPEEYTDPSLFKSRLFNLMMGKGIRSVKELAEKLYDNKLIIPKRRKNPGDENDIRRDAVETIRTTINKYHIHADGPENVSGEYLTAYCKFFGCSADYLLGFIDNPTHVATDVEAATGLSDHSIRHIVNDMKDGQRMVLDDIIKTGGIDEIYGALREWFYMSTYSGDNSFPENMQKDVAEFVAERYMLRIFDTLCNMKDLEDHFTSPADMLNSFDFSGILNNVPDGETLSKAITDSIEKAMHSRKFREDESNE